MLKITFKKYLQKQEDRDVISKLEAITEDRVETRAKADSKETEERKIESQVVSGNGSGDIPHKEEKPSDQRRILIEEPNRSHFGFPVSKEDDNNNVSLDEDDNESTESERRERTSLTRRNHFPRPVRRRQRGKAGEERLSSTPASTGPDGAAVPR